MTTRDYVFRLRGDADQLAQAHERAAAAADKHADQTADLVRQQAAAKTAQDNFIAGLKRQADSLGKSRAELAALQAAELGVSERAAPLIARLQAGDKAAAGFARSGKLTAIELQQVGFQLNDLAVQVASGSNPITALVQQGSQLSGTFGGVRPALSAVLSLLTPARVLFGGVAATVGLLATAYIQAQREEAKFRDGLVLSGNAAGVTRDSFAGMVATVREASGITAAASRDIVQGLVATGRVGPAAIASVSQAAATLARISGASADEVVKDFAGMSAGVAQWALNANKAYNFLTPEIYRHIRALEAQGKTEEAMRVASDALNKALTGRTRELGWLEKAWDATKKAASGAWDAMLNVGREQTVGERIVAMARALGDARAQLARGDQRAAPLVAAMETQLETLRLLQKGEQAAAKQRSDETTANNEALKREQEQHQAASASLQRSGFALQHAQAEAARQAELDSLQRSYDRGETGLAAYVARRTALEQQAIDAKRAAIDQDIALERQRQIAGDQSPEGLQRQARINDLLARRIALQTDQVKLAGQAERNFGIKLPEDRLGAFIDDQVNAANRRDEQRVEQSLRATDELIRNNRELGVSLIADDRARGEAQIALEATQLRARIDLTRLGTEQRQVAEGALADYVALRQRQLTEQLKPEWQRLTEGWADTTRQMRESGDRFLTGFLEQGEQTWLEFSRSGKVNLESFGRLVQDELARLTYRQFVAPGVASIGKTIAGAVGIKVPEAEGTGVVAAKAAEQLATESATSSLAAFKITGVDPTTAAMIDVAAAARGAAIALSSVGGGSTAGGLVGSIADWFGAGGGGDGSGIGLPGIGDGGAMPFPFAKGGAFDHGNVVRTFARGGVFGQGGGVLTEPTPFRMARGMGIAAEAGEPEAVVPLRRTRDGRLGVETAGGAAQGGGVQVNVYGAPEQPRVRTRQGRDGMQIDLLFGQFRDRLGEEIDNGVGLMPNIAGRSGINPSGGLMR